MGPRPRVLNPVAPRALDPVTGAGDSSTCSTGIVGWGFLCLPPVNEGVGVVMNGPGGGEAGAAGTAGTALNLFSSPGGPRKV